jgi:hypothetical protein
VNVGENSDYDFILVLDKYAPNDNLVLRKVVNKFPLHPDLNLSLLYQTDINARKKENFQLRSVLPDLYIYLEGAKVLTGKNLFKENPLQLSSLELTKIMDFKIQEYYGRCDKAFITIASNKRLFRQLQKYTREMLRMFLLRQNILKVHDVSSTNYSEIINLAKNQHLFPHRFNDLTSNLITDNYNKTKLLKIEIVRRIIYEKYLEVFSSGT